MEIQPLHTYSTYSVIVYRPTLNRPGGVVHNNAVRVIIQYKEVLDKYNSTVNKRSLKGHSNAMLDLAMQAVSPPVLQLRQDISAVEQTAVVI